MTPNCLQMSNLAQVLEWRRATSLVTVKEIGSLF
jgi:hypothetical protein